MILLIIFFAQEKRGSVLPKHWFQSSLGLISAQKHLQILVSFGSKIQFLSTIRKCKQTLISIRKSDNQWQERRVLISVCHITQNFKDSSFVL